MLVTTQRIACSLTDHYVCGGCLYCTWDHFLLLTVITNLCEMTQYVGWSPHRKLPCSLTDHYVCGGCLYCTWDNFVLVLLLPTCAKWPNTVVTTQRIACSLTDLGVCGGCLRCTWDHYGELSGEPPDYHAAVTEQHLDMLHDAACVCLFAILQSSHS